MRQIKCVIVTAEDHNIYGGVERPSPKRWPSGIRRLIEFVGLNDSFGTLRAEPDELAEHFGITAPFIAAAANCANEGPAMNRFS